MVKITIEEMAAFCKRKGFVYPNSEIYNGLAGFFDYGPYGVELKNNIKAEWWRHNVHRRHDVVGIDGSIIANPKVWEASGHVSSFADIILECSKCGNKVRGDHFLEEKLKISVEGLKIGEINELVEKNKLACPKCKSGFREARPFNLMFRTTIGPSSEFEAYLRPETAQLIFTNFKLVQENARLKLPFGIAQMGKAFRNEISPRDFMFRAREFEQMEIEYFINPSDSKCPFIGEFMEYEMNFFTAKMQQGNEQPRKMKMKAALKEGIISEWHAYWLSYHHKWFAGLGAKPDNFRIRQHLPDEKSHYATDTWDLEYNFPFGWKELEGVANRSDFDLNQHMKFSGVDLGYFDEQEKRKFIPHVVCEPSLGVERAFLVFMFDAYEYDKKRENIVLHLHPRLAPIKAAVFPLVSNKEELSTMSKKVYDDLKERFNVFYDVSGSVGRRYARQDELGTPYCITIDFDSLENQDATIRERDSTGQKRIGIKDLRSTLRKLIDGELEFSQIK